MKKFLLFSLLLSTVFLGCEKKKDLLRFGYSPNVTHAQALVGLDRGDFSRVFGANGSQAYVFNAGPSIIEALFAEEIDLAFVGPVPALNAFLRSDGRFVVISGSAQGGAGIVKSKKSGAKKLKDLAGGTLLTPQFGNTQDLMARAVLKGEGVNIFPASNVDHINIFRRGEADASWTVEPWLSRLIFEADGVLLQDEGDIWKDWGEPDYDTTVILVRKTYLESHPEEISLFLGLHRNLSEWLNQNPIKASEAINRQLARIQGKPLPNEVLRSAVGRIHFSNKLSPRGFTRLYKNLELVGWLKPALKGKNLDGFFGGDFVRADQQHNG